MLKTGGYLRVNGKDFPYPTRDHTIEEIKFVNSGRNMQGEIISELIGDTQYKLNLSWAALDGRTWTEMCKEFDKFYVDVEFYSMTEGKHIHRLMYTGNKSGKPYWIDKNDNVTMYENCKCNLIDMGKGDIL